MQLSCIYYFHSFSLLELRGTSMKNWLLDNLQTTGCKITKTRKQICREIEKLDGIFCAKQIIESIEINKVSVYRNLKALTKLNLIRPAINIRGEQFYEKNNNENHHHHIVCTKCLKTSCVDCSEPKLKSNQKFNNINHLLIFTGICNSCTK